MQKYQHITTIFLKQKFILIGLTTGILYWFVESWIHVMFFDATSFFTELLNPTAHETWKRLLVLALFFMFGIYSQYIINILRQAEADLQAREKELTLILENNPAGEMLVDAVTRRISWANTNALKMIGVTKEIIESMLWHNNLCPDELGDCPILDRGQEVDISERLLLTFSGVQIPVLKSVTRVNYEGRNHLLETFFDLSDRKKMERAVSLAHAELDQIFQTASVGMRVVDKNFNVLRINKTFELMTGINKKNSLQEGDQEKGDPCILMDHKGYFYSLGS